MSSRSTTDQTAHATAQCSGVEAPEAGGNPVGYVANAYGVNNVIYTDKSGNLNGLYYSFGCVARDALTALAGAPYSESDPSAYFREPTGKNFAFYNGPAAPGEELSNYALAAIHRLDWDLGAVTWTNLTDVAKALPPAVRSRPTAYFAAFERAHHVLYRGSDGDIHELRWTEP